MIFSPLLWAVKNPIKLEDLPKYSEELAFRIAKARVVLADYLLIRRDFPRLALVSDQEIDQWLLDHAAFMAETQVKQGVKANTNTPIEIKEHKFAFRPKKYGRALILNTGDGLIDIKGAGALEPKIGTHSNGLATLPEMIEEYVFEKLVHLVLKHHGQGDTIETYAVIDGGFNVNSNDQWHPAALVIRQAHFRRRNKEKTQKFLIEKVLRKYGLCTGWYRFKDVPYCYMNVQYSSERALVDFGCYHVREKFTDSLVYWGYEKNQDKALLLLDPNSPDSQPDPKLQILLREFRDFFNRVELALLFSNEQNAEVFQNRRRDLAYLIAHALKEQELFWESQKIEEDGRPKKRICGPDNRPIL